MTGLQVCLRDWNRVSGHILKRVYKTYNRITLRIFQASAEPKSGNSVKRGVRMYLEKGP